MEIHVRFMYQKNWTKLHYPAEKSMYTTSFTISRPLWLSLNKRKNLTPRRLLKEHPNVNKCLRNAVQSVLPKKQCQLLQKILVRGSNHHSVKSISIKHNLRVVLFYCNLTIYIYL